jgi:hypothetical protein
MLKLKTGLNKQRVKVQTGTLYSKTPQKKAKMQAFR